MPYVLVTWTCVFVGWMDFEMMNFSHFELTRRVKDGIIAPKVENASA